MATARGVGETVRCFGSMLGNARATDFKGQSPLPRVRLGRNRGALPHLRRASNQEEIAGNLGLAPVAP